MPSVNGFWFERRRSGHNKRKFDYLKRRLKSDWRKKSNALNNQKFINACIEDFISEPGSPTKDRFLIGTIITYALERVKEQIKYIPPPDPQ